MSYAQNRAELITPILLKQVAYIPNTASGVDVFIKENIELGQGIYSVNFNLLIEGSGDNGLLSVIFKCSDNLVMTPTSQTMGSQSVFAPTFNNIIFTDGTAFDLVLNVITSGGQTWTGTPNSLIFVKL